jgi:hypothetical protein
VLGAAIDTTAAVVRTAATVRILGAVIATLAGATLVAATISVLGVDISAPASMGGGGCERYVRLAR